MQILVVTTHLLGTGHLRRSINLSQAFVASGHRVTLVSGGMPVSIFDYKDLMLVQLPPVRSDGTNFTQLLDDRDAIADESRFKSREKKLVELVNDLQPDIIITELFPFGRRVLREEFLSLLKASHALPRVPVILSSVRDILAAPSSEKKIRQTEALISDYYDGVLVHSDRATTPLEASWPATDSISAKLLYTGYVTQPESDYIAKPVETDVVVSAGGGSVGAHIYETAIEVARLSPDRRWRILVGGNNAEAETRRLKILAADTSVVIEPNRPDFREILSGVLCSVSMCGYNTAIDLLLTGTPGVLVPFDAGGEQEQTLRATSLSSRSAFVLLLARQLTPECLGRAVEKAIIGGRFSTDQKKFNGAVESVRFATNLAARK